MKRYILTLLWACSALWLMAVPAMRVRLLITLDDGRTVMATAHGDEDLDFMLSDDGEVIIWQDSVYHGTGLSPMEYIATLPSLPKKARKNVGSLASALIQPQGAKKIPVILAAFKDKPFTVDNTERSIKNFYETFFNGKDIYATTGNWGSVQEYFEEQSLGQFMPEFSIIGPVTLDNDYTYYGEDSGSRDKNYSEFIRETLTKAQAIEEDWGQFDNNGDGKVDICFIIFAGMGQNYTNNFGDKNTLWPQEMPTSYSVNGITYSGCSTSCELRPTAVSGNVITDTQPDGVGVVIHEMSHIIGLPDLYDYNYVEFGMDFWSVMDYGMYIKSSKVPVGYTAYEREFVGWQQTETITGPCTLHLYCFDQGGKGYKLVNDANPNEYYILDNRQPQGWDWGMCSIRGHGMLVMHVDYNYSVWISNKVNTIVKGWHEHQSLTIIPANNTLIGSNNSATREAWQTSLQGNPYPGITENHELTDESTPASMVYTGSLMHKPLMDIEETEDGIVTVKVMPLGTLDAPKGLAYEDLGVLRAKAVWEAVENAEMYNLRVWSDGEEVFRQDSIGATSFILENLKDGRDYTFSVQAINDKYRNSEWTESESFRPTPDAITEITESTRRVRVYSMSGRMLGECYIDQLHRYTSRRGIYIIRNIDGSARKMMIRK